MNCTIEFTVNTSTKRFEEWLDRYRLRTLPFIVDLGEGKSLHVICAPTLDGEYRGLRIHKIEGRRSKPDPTEPSRAIGNLPFTLVQLEMFETAENRLNVKMAWNHAAISTYCKEFLSEVANLWPETKKTILIFLMKSMSRDEHKRLKVKTLQRDVYFSLEIIDASVYSTLRKLGYAVSSLDDESRELFKELDETFGINKPEKEAIREVTTPAIITYHWVDYELGIISGALGGIQLRKKQEYLTEITLFAPPIIKAETKAQNRARQEESLRRSKEITKQLELEGYFTDLETTATAKKDGEQKEIKPDPSMDSGKVIEGDKQRKSKRGRSKYSDLEKLEALEDWDSLDPSISGLFLAEFLENKFGITSGKLHVPESTFHSWRRSLIKKDMYTKS